MSVILLLEINRDFPYQVALPFDEDAMDVLDWLEGREFQWDMFVDIPENTVRYCFRTLDDASAFKRRFGNATEGRAVAKRALTWTGRTRWCCRRGSVNAAATMKIH